MNDNIKSLVKVNLTKNQSKAIESFVNDRGLDIFQNSTLLKVINAGDFEQVPTELSKWVVVNGKIDPHLVELRKKEVDLFQK